MTNFFSLLRLLTGRRAAPASRPGQVFGRLAGLLLALLPLLGQAQAPTLTAVAPYIGLPGTVVTLTGTNLTGTTEIAFNGYASRTRVTSGFTVNAAGTQITGVVVPDVAQSGQIDLTTSRGTTGASTAYFTRAATLATGNYHTASVKPDGSLWTWGENQYGQLGQGNISNSGGLTPARVGTGTDWTSVAAGDYQTVAVRANGTLWTWGRNNEGQLGNNATTDNPTPVQVGTATNWASAAAGGGHTLAVRADGTLWAWGRNTNGQLGNNSVTQSNVPVRVGTGTTWVSVSAGSDFTVAVQADGSLWTWGANGSGQLGTNASISTSSRVPVRVGTSNAWASAAAGGSHVAAVQTNGTLWTWGNNTNGQLGSGSSNTGTNTLVPGMIGFVSTWVSAASGAGHTLALRTNGTLWAWGRNDNGQLGTSTGNSAESAVPLQVGTGTDWTSAAAGFSHSAGERACRAVWAWGSNGYGQVGDGGSYSGDRRTPVVALPVISLLTLSPASAGAGSTVTATGVGLTGVFILTVNGANALASRTNSTATGFSFVVPAGASLGAGTVSVSNSCGTASKAFTVLAALSGVSPTIGVPGTVLTLTGQGLGGTTAIRFNGGAGVKTVTSGFTVNAAGTEITGVVVPDGARSGAITATTGTGVTTPADNPAYFTRATRLAAGSSHTVAVRADGTFWAWGNNSDGQLGDGSTTSSPVPVQVGTATNWVSVAAGYTHTLAVRADGTLWAWGSNSDGQLGDGSLINSPVPIQVGTDTNWASAAGGQLHTVAVRTDGTLWAWGKNANGQLGQGTSSSSYTSPTRVGTGTTWTSPAAGSYHSAAMRADGTLWTWGNNTYGQLGTNVLSFSPIQVGTATSWASVSAGDAHTLAVRTDGTLWAWGYNSDGQLGNGSTTTSTVPVQVGTATSWASAAAGSLHNAAVRADGTLWAWGRNSEGQLGTGTTTDSMVPVQAGPASTWTSALVGGGHSAGEQRCRTVWTWGYNNYGQLGDGSTTQRNTPVSVFDAAPLQLLSFSPANAGTGSTVAVTGTGLLGLTALTVNGASALASVTNSTAAGFSFVVPAGASLGAGTVSVSTGCNSASKVFTVLFVLTGVSPAIGLPGTVVTLTGTRLSGATSITFAGSAGVKTVTSGFTVNAAGTEITGVVVPNGAQSGPITVTTPNGSTTPGSNPVLFSRARTLATGSSHTVAVRADGTLWAWGNNSDGQLGDGSTTNSPVPVQVGTGTSWVSVAAGYTHTLAVRADGTLWAWGSNSDGQLGDGSLTNSPVPVQVGTGTDWASAAVGGYHTLAVRTDGTLWAWGNNEYSQLGNNSSTNSAVPVQIGTATNWVSAAGGTFHTLAIRADGTLWAWGSNYYGQLSNNSTTTSAAPVQVGTATNWVSAGGGGGHTVAVRTDGTLWAWGYNAFGQLGNNSSTSSPVPVQVGAATSWVSVEGGLINTVAVRADGTLWNWGDNEYGQLGNGTTTASRVPLQVGTATSWVSADAGSYFTAGEQRCRVVWAWGYNNYGQVGDGSTTNRLSPVSVLNAASVQLLSFSPASAGVGSTVAVTGTGLLGLTALTVNGANALASITNGTATGFSFVVPAGASPGAGTVSVSTGCDAASRAFTVSATGPVVSSFTPSSGAAGTSVTLTGANLSGATVVTVNGVVVTPTSVTGTTLTFVVPAGASATQRLTVTTPTGTSVASTAFAVLLNVADTAPVANARTAPVAGSVVAVTFTEPVTTASAATLAVFSAQRGGRKAGTVTVAGSSARFTAPAGTPHSNFMPGEVVSVSVPASVLGAGGLPASKRVYQFTTAVGGPGRGSFQPGSDLAVGLNPQCLATGDVNGDGSLDVVTANYNAGTVSLRLGTGTGTGTFVPAPTPELSIGTQPSCLALGDVDGDGDLDLLVGVSGTATLNVRLNNGSGSFSGSQNVPVGSLPTIVAPGDLDGDGDLDLVVSNGGSNTVSVRLNDGTGTFSVPATGAEVAVGSGPYSVALGDLDGDGDLDFAAGNNNGNTVSVRLNDGASGFSAPATNAEVAVAAGPNGVVLGDVDGDGDLDLAVGGSGTNVATVLRNDGTGNLSTRTDVPTGPNPGFAALGDVDADGDLDLVTGNYSGTLSVRLNSGSGAFVAPPANPDPAVNERVVMLVLGDVDNDGDLDALAIISNNTLSVLLNQAPAPLPVELIAFTATLVNKAAVRLAWATASEKNSAFFEVERSLDGRTFAHIGTLAAAGNSATPRSYELLDAQLLTGATLVYYRLKQMDLDGTFSYSPVRTVALTPAAAGLALYPNPTRAAVTLTGAQPGAAVTVLDALGRQVLTAPADAAGTAVLALPAGLVSGVYVVRTGSQALRLTVE